MTSCIYKCISALRWLHVLPYAQDFTVTVCESVTTFSFLCSTPWAHEDFGAPVWRVSPPKIPATTATWRSKVNSDEVIRTDGKIASLVIFHLWILNRNAKISWFFLVKFGTKESIGRGLATYVLKWFQSHRVRNGLKDSVQNSLVEKAWHLPLRYTASIRSTDSSAWTAPTSKCITYQSPTKSLAAANELNLISKLCIYDVLQANMTR